MVGNDLTKMDVKRLILRKRQELQGQKSIIWTFSFIPVRFDAQSKSKQCAFV